MQGEPAVPFPPPSFPPHLRAGRTPLANAPDYQQPSSHKERPHPAIAPRARHFRALCARTLPSLPVLTTFERPATPVATTHDKTDTQSRREHTQSSSKTHRDRRHDQRHGCGALSRSPRTMALIICNDTAQVSDIKVSKTGKHGHAKCRFTAIDIFDGSKVIQRLIQPSPSSSCARFSGVDLVRSRLMFCLLAPKTASTERAPPMPHSTRTSFRLRTPGKSRSWKGLVRGHLLASLLSGLHTLPYSLCRFHIMLPSSGCRP